MAARRSHAETVLVACIMVDGKIVTACMCMLVVGMFPHHKHAQALLYHIHNVASRKYCRRIKFGSLAVCLGTAKNSYLHVQV
jgi:hypothetical protein